MLEVVRLALGNVCFGSKADIEAPRPDVRFTPKSRHCGARLACPLCAKSGHSPSPRRSTNVSFVPPAKIKRLQGGLSF